MHILCRLCLLLLFSASASLCVAQFDTRPPSGLESRSSGNSQPLIQEQAFPFYVSETGQNQLRITWTPASGHYLYRHAFAFSLQNTGEGSQQNLGVTTTDVTLTEVALTDVTLTDGLRKTDQFFGEIEAYYDTVSADIVLPDHSGTGAILLIQFQGCADWGFCYPPQRREFPLTPTAAR